MIVTPFRNSGGDSQERGRAMDRTRVARPQSDSHTFSFPGRIHNALDAWARRKLGTTDHERRVAQIADAWFRLTRDMHHLDRRMHWALTASCIVHDVGRSIDPAEHASVGAELILSDPALSLSPSARRWLAYLTLYHRGSVPEVGRDEILKPTDDRPGLLKALALLRASDTLDSRAIEPPRLVLMRRSRLVQVWCFLREPCSRAERAFSRPKKYRLLEETLGCTVQVDVHQADACLVPA